MNNNEYLIVHKSILPNYFEQIIKTRELIAKDNLSVSDACKKMDISRSTFYKYKDYIFRLDQDYQNKASIAIMAEDKKGILSDILKILSNYGANVISINQDTPIDGMALITITVDLTESKDNIGDIDAEIMKLEGVKNAQIIGGE